jgi:SAM-dependent methyltransferase
MSRLISSLYRHFSGIRERLKGSLPRDSLLFRLLRPASQLVERVFPLYRRLTGDAVFYRESELAQSSLYCPRILDKTLELFNPKTALDLGCGTGMSMDYLMARGVSVTGIDGSDLAIKRARHPERMIKHNLNRELNLGKKFDMVWSYEVVEHIHPRYVENLVKTFSNHSDLIVMSAAPPGQGGEGHFNEQHPSYWIAMFSRVGYSLDEEATEQLRITGDPFCLNMLVLRR